ncbi:MAG: RNA polymerase sigma factor [Melioribacteraceae bacterium]|nr:RNA polymerase sigma factor [Melioribacteraceae bacterium]
MTFEDIINHYGDMVYNHCFKFTRNKETAKDLTQEIFLKIYQNLSRFRREANIKTWIYRITVNTCLTAINSAYSKKMKQSISVDLFSMKKSAENIEEQIIIAENANNLQEALQQLSPNDQQIVILFYYDQLSYEEISKVLNIPLGTVGINLFRARKKLKKILQARNDL